MRIFTVLLAKFHAESVAFPRAAAEEPSYEEDKILKNVCRRWKGSKALKWVNDNFMKSVSNLKSSEMIQIVCHGDVWAGNVAFKEGCLTLLDVECASFRHPLTDLCFAIVDSVDPSQREIQQTLQLYHKTLVCHSGYDLEFCDLEKDFRDAMVYSVVRAMQGGIFPHHLQERVNCVIKEFG